MMDKKYLIRGSIVSVVVLILAPLSNMVGYSVIGVGYQQTTPNSTVADARFSADVNGDGTTEARGWISYTLEKGIAGRIIKITGSWGTDDGNFTGSLIIKNVIFSKFYGTYRGIFLGNISGENYTAKIVGFLYNDWEVGYWKIFIPNKIHVQVVHIPFN